jgi:hypothetical protein
VSALAWESLTEVEQIRRLRPLALGALHEFSVDPLSLSLVGGFTNVIVRVDTEDGPCALRVDPHQDHSDEDVEIELAWLTSLAQDTDLDIVLSYVANLRDDPSDYYKVAFPRLSRFLKTWAT